MVFPRHTAECPKTSRPGGPIVVRSSTHLLAGVAALVTVSLLTCGCTSFSEYVHNGFKVGPNYRPPPAAVAKDWIDAADVRVKRSDDLSRWWTVFDDPCSTRSFATPTGRTFPCGRPASACWKRGPRCSSTWETSSRKRKR